MDPVTNYCAAILGENQEAMSAIRLIPELADCSDELLQMIYTYSKTVDTQPGEILIQEGLFDQWVYFIIQGELDVVINGEHLGTTGGPIVGERCILGEPRGADLVTGEEGLMALGVEMSIIDELNRDINNFQQTASSDEEAEAYANDRMAVALELFYIILNEVIGRITHLYDSGVQGAKHLDDSDEGWKVKTKGLYDFSEDIDSESDETTTHQFTLFSFNDFAETVYYEILQKFMSDYGFSEFPIDEWHRRFAIEKDGKVSIRKAFDWLHQEYKIANTILVDIAGSVFEIASQYTAAANKAANQVFSAFERERDKKRAQEASNQALVRANAEMISRIRQDLFDPIEARRGSTGLDKDSEQQGSSKMSQDDIDALFG